MGKARKLRREKERTEQSKTISQWIWSWGVVGAVILGIFVGGGYVFMTSGHPYIADIFFLIGAGLFLAKFLTWELPRKHERRNLIQIATICFIIFITTFSILGNHYLMYGKQLTVEEIVTKVVEQLAKKEQKSLTNEFPDGFIIFGLMKPGEQLIKGFVPIGIEVNWNTGGVIAVTQQTIVFTLPDIKIDRSTISNMIFGGNRVELSRQLGVVQLVGMGDLSLQVKVLQVTEPIIIALGLVKKNK